MLGRVRDLAEKIRADGLAPTLRRVREIARDAIVPPWNTIYWLNAREVVRIPPVSGARLRVVHRLEELGEDERRDLTASIGTSAMPLVEQRLLQGVELHLLLVDEKVAGTRFVVFGSSHPFQNVVLTARDTMGLDVRIDPRFRGSGLAPLFFSLSIAELAERGIERIFAAASVHNDRSNRTLVRVGFQPLLRYREKRGIYRYDRKPLA